MALYNALNFEWNAANHPLGLTKDGAPEALVCTIEAGSTNRRTDRYHLRLHVILVAGRSFEYMDAVARYLEEIQAALAAISRDDVRFVVEALTDVWQSDATIFLIGNGGSASTASHMMNDLCKFTAFDGVRRLRAMALTDNVPLMTAYANDIDFDSTFVEPLSNFMRPGDMLIAISGSGNSRNIIAACYYAIEHGGTVIGLCGKPGGLLAQIAHHRVIVPAAEIGQQEDGHLVLNHVIATALRERIAALSGRSAVPTR